MPRAAAHSALPLSPAAPFGGPVERSAGSTSGAETAFARLHAALLNARAEPSEDSSWRELREARRQASAVIAQCSRKEPQHPTITAARQLVRDVSLSGVQDWPAGQDDIQTADTWAKGGWPGLLAAMLGLPAWQWPAAPGLDQVPDWLWGDYTAWQFAPPQAFTALGQVECYATFLLGALETLARWAERNFGSAAVRAAIDAFISTVSFAPLYLSRQGLRRHAELRARILLRSLGKAVDDYDPLPTPRHDRKMRIGFVCRDFGPHAETFSAFASFEHLDPERFEVVLFAHRPTSDRFEDVCKKHSKEFYYLPADLPGQLSAVRVAALDVAVFGSDVTVRADEVAFLALHRVAPLQVLNSATPITSGFPSVDLYLCGALGQLPDAPSLFSERLGLLPGAARAFTFPAAPPDPSARWARAALGLPHDAFVFVSTAAFTEITPETQHSWARLLQAVPRSRLLLHPFGLGGAESFAVKRCCAQLDQVLASHQVSGDRLIVSANVFASRAELNALRRVGDLSLDADPCGGISALAESLSCGLLAVVREGPTPRSRAASAVLRAMELDELVVESEQDQHDLTVCLANTPRRAGEIRARLERGMARSPFLFDSLAASDALGALIETAYDQIVTDGWIPFRAQRIPLQSASQIDLAAVESLLKAGSTSLALTALQAFLAVDPGQPKARHLLGRTLLKVGRAERATLYLLEAVQQLEDDASAWCDLARAFQANRQPREAAQALQVCLGIDGHSLDALLLLGEIADHGGQSGQLAEVVQLLETIAPGDRRVQALRARSQGQSRCLR